ncbi:MAG TPA: type II CRISPR-associated endonuclease Cas1 [Candidatus Xenobia bacterium]|nr:type II CRISPR-associated endonuclease Cas1 [Candidatus Xenobia bacterium]
MIKRILEVSSGPARLSIAHRQLVISRDNAPDATIPCEDIGVLLIDHPAVSYTHAVFTTLAEMGAAVVLCGINHHPTSLLLPLEGNAVQTERYRAQLDASLPLKKRLWQALVAGKIRLQAAVLKQARGEDAGLEALARRVRSGDPENLEAQAAQRYWPRLLGSDFRRRHDGPPPNLLLNYGYTALRAAAARALCAAGLLPTVGIHHHNRSNAFCLADDIVEPYRPYVDWRVHRLVEEKARIWELNRENKQALLSLFNETVGLAERKTPLLLAFHATAASLNEAFQTGEPALALPSGLPVAAEESTDESEKEPLAP